MKYQKFNGILKQFILRECVKIFKNITQSEKIFAVNIL